MAQGYFPILTLRGTTCHVAGGLEKLNQPWESYLQSWKEQPGGLNSLEKVTGISIRGWICNWEADEVKVLLGQRAEEDSSPGLYEAFGGKCDPRESILEALTREVFEETGQDVLFIHALLGVDIFLTPRSKRWIAQPHFLIEVERGCESLNRRGFHIRLDPVEHQSYIWAPENLDALDSLQLTEATSNHFGLAVAAFREKHPEGSRQRSFPPSKLSR
jgi:8-oxo-dGTP pyrophosphatase MutT (NUDIX family)